MPATLTATPSTRAVKQRALALEQYLRPTPGSTTMSGPASVLVSHGHAFLAKTNADIASLTANSELSRNTLYTLQAELMLDVAIGTALLREFQPAIDEAVAAGELAGAKELTQLGHRLRKGVASAQKVISEAGRSDASRLADVMTEIPCEAAPTTGALDQVAREIGGDYDRGKRKARVRRQILSQVRLPSRTELLVTALACALLLWVGLAKLPEFLHRGPRLIVGEDFTESSVLEVVARPPSLFVTLDASSWESADTAARDSMLAELVSVPLVDDDYRGALIKTSDGRPVAAWIRGAGIRQLETVEPVAPPGAAEKAKIFEP